MLGRQEPLIMKTVWTSKTHPCFCFTHYRFCSIPNMVLDGNPIRVLHYLPRRNQSWTFPGIPSCWASSTIMPMSSGIHSISGKQGFIWGLYSKSNPGRDVKSGFIFIFKEELSELFLSASDNVSGTHWEILFCLTALYLSCENSEFGTSSSDHHLTISPSCHIAFNKL